MDGDTNSSSQVMEFTTSSSSTFTCSDDLIATPPASLTTSMSVTYDLSQDSLPDMAHSSLTISSTSSSLIHINNDQIIPTVIQTFPCTVKYSEDFDYGDSNAFPCNQSQEMNNQRLSNEGQSHTSHYLSPSNAPDSYQDHARSLQSHTTTNEATTLRTQPGEFVTVVSVGDSEETLSKLRFDAFRDADEIVDNEVSYLSRRCEKNASIGRERYVEKHGKWSSSELCTDDVEHAVIPSKRTVFDCETSKLESPVSVAPLINVCDKVVVLRLPGERLGLGLKFDGGWGVRQLVRRVFIESIAVDSPGSRATLPWGQLCSGDQILNIEGVPVSSMTRLQCVAALRDSHVRVTIGILKGDGVIPPLQDGPNITEQERPESHPRSKSINYNRNCEDRKRLPPPPLPPRIECVSIITPMRPPKEIKSFPCPPSGFIDEPAQYFVPEIPQVPLPPAAAIYLDLLAEEEERRGRCGSESDETGSSASTVIDRLSLSSSTTVSRNSSFNTSAAADNVKYSRFDLASALSQFEILEREFEKDSSSTCTIESKEAASLVNETYPNATASANRERRQLIRSLSLSPGTYKDQIQKMRQRNEERSHMSKQSMKSLSFSLRKRHGLTPIKYQHSTIKRTQSFSGRGDLGSKSDCAPAYNFYANVNPTNPLSINTSVNNDRSQENSPDSGNKSLTNPNSLSSNESADFSPNDSLLTESEVLSVGFQNEKSSNLDIESLNEDTFISNVPCDSSPKLSLKYDNINKSNPSSHVQPNETNIRRASNFSSSLPVNRSETGTPTDALREKPLNVNLPNTVDFFTLKGGVEHNQTVKYPVSTKDHYCSISNEHLNSRAIVTIQNMINCDDHISSNERFSPITVNNIPMETTEQNRLINVIKDTEHIRCVDKLNEKLLVDKFDRIAAEFYDKIDEELNSSSNDSNVDNSLLLEQNIPSDERNLISLPDTDAELVKGAILSSSTVETGPATLAAKSSSAISSVSDIFARRGRKHNANVMGIDIDPRISSNISKTPTNDGNSTPNANENEANVNVRKAANENCISYKNTYGTEQSTHLTSNLLRDTAMDSASICDSQIINTKSIPFNKKCLSNHDVESQSFSSDSNISSTNLRTNDYFNDTPLIFFDTQASENGSKSLTSVSSPSDIIAADEISNRLSFSKDDIRLTTEKSVDVSKRSISKSTQNSRYSPFQRFMSEELEQSALSVSPRSIACSSISTDVLSSTTSSVISLKSAECAATKPRAVMAKNTLSRTTEPIKQTDLLVHTNINPSEPDRLSKTLPSNINKFTTISRSTRIREDLEEIIENDLEKFKKELSLPEGFEVQVEEEEEIEQVLECESEAEVAMIVKAFRCAQQESVGDTLTK